MGIILDAELDIVPNTVYKRQTAYMDYRDFYKYYKANIESNPDVGLMYGRLSVSPGSYLTEFSAHVYRTTHFDGEIPRLRPGAYDALDRFVLNVSKTGSAGRWVRWTLEKRLEPRVHNCISRNQALNGEDECLVTRNEEMYDSMDYLRNRLKDTDILQEYFIPPKKMAEFVDGLRTVVQSDGANLINVTLRVVHKDDVTGLPYATGDRFAFVLYFNQELNETQSRILQKTTVDLIDLSLRLGGTFYLPYQLYYSADQLRRGYPQIEQFFALKHKYDPIDLFTNKFYEKYGTQEASAAHGF
jgi:FAD/FMN-containing dehydrogenase